MILKRTIVSLHQNSRGNLIFHISDLILATLYPLVIFIYISIQEKQWKRVLFKQELPEIM
jgi:hypothetical protein